MKAFAVDYKQTYRKTFLVEAESFDEAADKVSKFDDNNEILADDLELYLVAINKSEDANKDGTATKKQLETCDWLHI